MKIKLYGYVVFQECDTHIYTFASEKARDVALRRQCAARLGDSIDSPEHYETGDLVCLFEEATDFRVHLSEHEVDIPELDLLAEMKRFLQRDVPHESIEHDKRVIALTNKVTLAIEKLES